MNYRSCPIIKWVRTIGQGEFFEGKCIKIYGSLQDITERKNTETERTKMISDIFQRNSNLEQFSYIVSHNLRAPTANIIGFVE
ncbi:MAG: signal transduction histidine kinase, partial [Sediminicola sp.]